MNDDKFTKQIRSINYAIKELNKELRQAIEKNDYEWTADCNSHISNLESAKDSVEAIRALSQVLAG